MSAEHHTARARKGFMNARKRLAAAITFGGGTATLALVLLRRRLGPLRCGRGLAVLWLAVRGGVRYAGSAPRLFAAAGESRQRLREDLALQTAEDVAGRRSRDRQDKPCCEDSESRRPTQCGAACYRPL
jgi:hypothetical protein